MNPGDTFSVTVLDFQVMSYPSIHSYLHTYVICIFLLINLYVHRSRCRYYMRFFFLRLVFVYVNVLSLFDRSLIP